MALVRHAGSLKRIADYNVHEISEVETADNEDHAFYGIMFDVEVKNTLPVEFVQISSLWVRGHLGRLRVYYSTTSHRDIYDLADKWTLSYEKNKRSSPTQYTELKLNTPVKIKPGERFGFYIHSSSRAEGIVYDDERYPITHEDTFIRIYSGLAHVTDLPFENNARNGWGWAWRPHREFVGKLTLGVRYFLWRPDPTVHQLFCSNFRRGVNTLLVLANRKHELNKIEKQVPYQNINADLIYVIANMLPWDWFGGLQVNEQPVIKTKSDRQDNIQGISWAMDMGDLGEEEDMGWRVPYQQLLRQHRLRWEARNQAVAPNVVRQEEDDDEAALFDGY